MNKNKLIELNNIELSTNNPRYTELNSLDDKLIYEMILANESYNEKKVIKELLSQEGDFSNLLNLFESIKISGFVTDGDKPILIINKQKFIVAEGNRRMMILKMISNTELLDWFPKNKSPDVEEKDTLYTNEEHFKNSTIDIDKNIDKIKQICFELNSKKDFNFTTIAKKRFELVKNNRDDEEKLWSLIYTKHIAGERPGLRRWPRSKYFIDILNFFPNGIEKNDEIKKKILVKIKRNLSTIISDYKYAQFVRDFFKENYIKDEINWKDVMKISKVSGLQQNYSLARIKNAAVKAFFPNKINFDDYFKINFNDKYEISYTGQIKSLDMFKFIWQWWKNGAITTRAIPDKYKNEFVNSVYFFLKNELITLDKMTLKKITELNLFKLSISQLNRMKDNLPSEKTKENDMSIKIIISVKKLKENIKDIIIVISENDKLRKTKPFDLLIEQFDHNYTPTVYYNAIASTIRSLYEQILIWGISGDANLLRKIIPAAPDSINDQELINNWYQCLANPNNKDATGEKLNYGRVSSMFLSIRNKIPTYADMKQLIMNITKLNEKQALEIARFFIDQNTNLTYINEFIHAIHRVELLPNYKYSADCLSDWIKKVKEIYKNLNQDFLDKAWNKVELEISKLFK